MWMMMTPNPNLPISAPIARVSLEKQAKNGYSLETQINIMSEINAKEGFATNSEYILVDDGFEGDDWDRPAINKGLELMRAGKIKGLTFMETDRFARDMRGGLELIRKVSALGGFIILGDLGIVRDEANFQLMLHVKLAISQFQKASIKVKSRGAVITKVKRGEIHTSRPPYGYDYLPKAQGSKLIVNKEKAKIVRKIFQWYDKGWSCRRIVRQLVADGVPAPGRPRKDGVQPRWNPGFISEMMKNESYIGTWFYNKNKSIEPETIRSTGPRHRRRTSHVLKDRADWIMVAIEAIIDQPLFERCRARALSNPYNLGGRPSDRYILKGLCWCGDCGHRMNGVRRRKHYRDLTAPRKPDGSAPFRCDGPWEYTYRCRFEDRITGETLCRWHSVKAEALESLVWVESITVLSDEALLRRLLAEHDQKSATKAGDRERIQGRIDELFQTEMAYRADSGRVTGSKAQQTREHYRKLIEEIQAQRETLERELAQSAPTGARVDVAMLVAAVRRVSKDATRTERQELLNRWVSRVEYHDGEVTIHLQIPLTGKSAQNCPGNQDHPNSFAHLVLTRRLAA